MAPIKGLTDQGMQFPQIGEIRKGAKKTTNAPGKDLEYFRVEFTPGNEEAEKIFETAYGSEPPSFKAWLPFPDVDRCWDVWYEAYLASSMIARADGEKFIYLRNHKTGEVIVRDGKRVDDGKIHPFHPEKPVCTYIGKDKGEEKFLYAEATGRLKVIIPILGRLSFLMLHTKSIWDLQHISGNLEAVKFVNRGLLTSIDLLISRKPKMVSTPMPDGRRVRTLKWLVDIEVHPDWIKKNKTKQLESSGKDDVLTIGPGDGDNDKFYPVEDFPDIPDIIEGEYKDVEEKPVVDKPVDKTTIEKKPVEKSAKKSTPPKKKTKKKAAANKPVGKPVVAPKKKDRFSKKLIKALIKRKVITAEKQIDECLAHSKVVPDTIGEVAAADWIGNFYNFLSTKKDMKYSEAAELADASYSKMLQGSKAEG